MPSGTVHSSCTDPTEATKHLVIVLVSKIQKSGTGDNNFVKWLTDHFGPTDQDNGTVKVDHLQIKAGPKCSGWTKPKWCVPFDVTTEISVVLG